MGILDFFAKKKIKETVPRNLTDFGGHTDVGIYITEEYALKVSAVYSCVKVISEDIAKLPIKIFEQKDNSRELIKNEISDLLNVQPNVDSTAITFRQVLTASALLWGNGYAQIERDRLGNVLGLWFIHPSQVEVDRTSNNEIVYVVKNYENNQEIIFNQLDIFHLPNVTFNGIIGESVVGLARQGIGLSLASERFGATLFGNSGVPKGILEHPGNITEQAAKNLRESWHANYGGSKSNGLAVLEEGMKYTQISIPPEDAQFLESRQFQVTDISRWFRVPPHKIGDLSKATFSNIEQQSKEYVDDTLTPWAVRWEQEIKRKLLNDGQGAKINFNALLRGDSQSRSEFYTKMLDRGVFNINEVRELEDMNPIDGGDLRTVPMNMTTIENLSKGEQDEKLI